MSPFIRTGTREEPGTLTKGAPVFPGSSRLGIEPKTPGCGTREEPGTLTQGAPVFPGSSRVCVDSECLIGKQKKPILKGHRLGAEFHTVTVTVQVWARRPGARGPAPAGNRTPGQNCIL